MRLAIEHHTHYRFSEPQARIVQMLRMTPAECEGQAVVSWLISVTCDARLRDAVDGFGNAVTMLYAEGPIAGLDLTVTGEVLTGDTAGLVRGAVEPLPPPLFCRTTPRTAASAALAEFARDVATGAGLLDRLHRLNVALAARFPDTPDGPDTGIAAGDAFATGKITSRDLAQVFIAAARSLGVPARYVSGYRSDGSPHCAPHGWAEAHVEGLGWVGFDPAAGISPDEAYVRVAVGLDAAAAAPIAGTRIGAGAERLDVDLTVDQLGGDG